MSADLERIAKAIAVALGEDLHAASPGMKKAARAAVEEMLKPSEAMINAGRLVPGSPGFCDEPGEPPDAEEIFEAMVEAILK